MVNESSLSYNLLQLLPQTYWAIWMKQNDYVVIILFLMLPNPIFAIVRLSGENVQIFVCAKA